MSTSTPLPPSKTTVALNLLRSLALRAGIADQGEFKELHDSKNGRAKDSFLLVGILTSILAASLNVSNLHMYWHQGWTLSGDLCQSLWDRFLDLAGDDAFRLYVIGSTILINGLYWGVGMIYIFMDITGWPLWIRKYKTQPGVHEPLEPKKFFSAVGQILFNQFVVGIPFTLAGYWVMDIMGSIQRESIRTLPSFFKVLVDFIIFALVEEVGFYYSHRLLHHRLIYKRIHKKHHEWQSPIAVTAIYCHPLEHILSNLLPPAMGPALMGSHLSVMYAWFAYAILRTLNDHSGYHLPGFPSPEAHDYHHLKFTECFGFLGILDYFHGTDKSFRSSAAYKRHTISLSLEPLRSLFPDAKVVGAEKLDVTDQ